MNFLKKIIIVFAVIVVAIETLIGAVPNNMCFSPKSSINVGVVFYRFDDPFVIQLRQSLENIEKNNQRKIHFSFYDSKNNQAIQNEIIDTLLENEDIDILILSLVNLRNGPKEIINRIKVKNIPVIFASKRTVKIEADIIKSYDKSYYIVPDSEQGGMLQGKLIADFWNKNKNIIDTNKDDIMQYVMLQGDSNNFEAIQRTKYSIITVEDSGIKIQELASKVGNWNEDEARNKIEGLLISYGLKIEVIIANNDAMAIGATKALQKFGYNKGPNTKIIPVFGFDAIPATQEFIKNGFMAGTVFQDANIMAEAFYEISMHLVNNNTRFDCIKYRCDDSGRIIELPFQEYTG